jgi:peptidoglycan/LPS O-acetylase OafA/YrhL
MKSDPISVPLSEHRRVPALDGFRALAALSVLIAHLYPTDTVLWRSLQFGRFGVVAFFTLSGFLIIDLLLSARARIEAGTSAKSEFFRFYARRSLRIFPLYYGIVLAFAAFHYAPVSSVLGWHLAYLSNIGYSVFRVDFANLSHFWSLCVEEQFYLVIPSILLCFPARRSFKMLIASLVICMLFKCLVAIMLRDTSLLARLPMSNVEGIAVGGLIAYARREASARSMLAFMRRWLVAPSIIATAGFAALRLHLGDEVYALRSYMIFPDAVFAVVFGALIATLLERGNGWKVSRILGCAPMRYLGAISYGSYAFHFALLPFLPVLLGPMRIRENTYPAFFVAITCTYAIASLSWFAFEKPILSLKGRLNWSRVPPSNGRAVQ